MSLPDRLTVPLAPSTWSIRPFQPRLPARVTTKAGTPTLAKNTPWIRPTTAPPTRAESRATHWLTPWVTFSTAKIAAHRPLTEPTERSISPSSSTNTTPIAIMPVPTICCDRLERFWADRKELFRLPKTAQITISASTTGSEPSSPLVMRRRNSPR